MLSSSRAQNTMRTYHTAWQTFQLFRSNYNCNASTPPTIEQVALFISYMSWSNYSANTISTYISALSFHERSHNREDITQNFPIKRLVEGCRRRHARLDVRCPITMPLLHKLIATLPLVCQTSYHTKLFTATFLLAFFGFLRIGEFTSQGRSIPLLEADVIVRGNPPQRKVSVRIRSSKTDQRGRGCVILLPESRSLCPVKAIVGYLEARPQPVPTPGIDQGFAFFRQFDGSPLTRQAFNRVLHRSISFLGLPAHYYTAHSFRIGAATSAAMAGFSDSHIQKMGRWVSGAYRGYIRLPAGEV